MKLSKKIAGFMALGLVSSLAITAVAYAVVSFGPSRPTFTWLNTANYITFNSITDNPTWGDERYFVKARDVSASTSTYSNSVNVKDGQEFLVTTYFHNNAAANLNLVAQNTKVKVEMPNESDKNQSLKSYISASNSNPLEVWSTMDFNGTEDFTLQYVKGSAKLKTNKVDMALSDSVIAGGVLVGTNGTDGKVPGCGEFSGYVSFKVKVQKKTTPPPAPQFKCDALTVSKISGRTIKAEVKYTATNGAALESVSYNFGDGSTPLVTDKTSVQYTYAKDGNYTVTATLAFSTGKETGGTSKCTAQVSFNTPVEPPVTPPTEPELPNTGAGSVIGIVAGASAAGTALHYGLALRRARNEDL